MEFKTIPNPMTEELKAHDNQVKREETPLPVSPGVISLFVGKKGSGKTTVLVSLLKSKKSPYYNEYDRIYMFSPTGRKDKKLEFLVDEISQYGNFYDELTNEDMQEVLDKIRQFNEEYIEEQMKESDDDIEDDPVLGAMKKKKRKSKKPKVIRDPKNLVILDDCIHSISASQKANALNQLATQSRHFKTDVWITTQKYNKLPLLIRTQADTLTLFRTDNDKEFKAIADDWAINDDLLRKVFDFATEEPNSFLHISFFGGKPVFYKKYDKIVF
jgi:ABC-type phosphonate transport system ATPase subunit